MANGLRVEGTATEALHQLCDVLAAVGRPLLVDGELGRRHVRSIFSASKPAYAASGCCTRRRRRNCQMLPRQASMGFWRSCSSVPATGLHFATKLAA
jgi:hypothetical protein